MAANVYDSIMLFGDSITQMSWVEGGLAQRLSGMYTSASIKCMIRNQTFCISEVYQRRMDVINRGLGKFTQSSHCPLY